MERFKTLYDDLLSNYEEVALNFAYVTKGKLQSKYFTASCEGVYQPVDQASIDIKKAKDRITATSQCFPNGPNSNVDYIMDCGSASNAIIISTLLQHDKDLVSYIASPSVGICDKGIAVRWPESTGMETPTKLSGLIPKDMIVMKEEPGVQSITVSDRFIVEFIDQVTNSLSLLGYHYDFVHGHLTHRDLCFKQSTSGMQVMLCHLEHAALSYVSGDTFLRVRRKPEGVASKFIGSFIPTSSDGFRFNLEPKRFWETSFSKLELPYFRSFDYYTLILSCLSLEYFFMKVMSNFMLKSIVFDPLFSDDQVSDVYKELVKAVTTHKPLEFDDIISLLKRYTMRCNAIDITRKRLEKLKPYI